MHRSISTFHLCAAAMICLGHSSTTSWAYVIDLAPPPATYAGEPYTGEWPSVPGDRRSFIFEDIAPFQLRSVDIAINPSATTTLTASLHAITGQDTPSSQLASHSVIVADLGRAFYNIPLVHSFTGNGARYLLDVFCSPPPMEQPFYSFEGIGDANMPIDPPYLAGPIRVIDGKGPSMLGESNYVIAHFRIDVVPEPRTIGLLLLSAVGALFSSRRRHA